MRAMNRATRFPSCGALLLFVSLVPLIDAHVLAAAPFPITRLYSGVASAGGANNTEWHSEVVLANATGAASDLFLEIVPRDQTNVVASTSMTLAAGETRRLPDLYAALGAPSGAGTLRLTGDALVWVRTFNQTANGTFGLDVPGVATDGGFPAGSAMLFPINTPVDVAREFRSNLLVTNLEAKKLSLTLSAGTAIRTFDVEAGTFAQISGVGSWLGAPTGSSMLSVLGTGRWFGQVTTIDPVLGDPTGMRGLTATTRDTRLFAGVASASGMNGTVWRSEGHLYNPRLAPQSVKLEILPRGGSSVAASTTLSLGPLEMKSLPDVYSAVGAASGAAVLRVTGDVLAWVRTFNKGPEATFGTDVPEVAPGVGYGSGASVAFPISTAADVTTGFRSNFLVTNHESRAITCTFSAGAISGSVEVPGGSFIQKDNLGAFLGLPPGTRTVKVTANGRWSAIVTAIDPYLGDPTTFLGLLTSPNPVPTAAGEPAGSVVSATVGPGGGTLASPDGRLTLTVPAGALTAATTLTVQPVTNLAWGGLGSAYRLGPDGTVFSKPATVTFVPTAEDTSSVNLAGLGVGFRDENGYWQWVTSATRDQATNRISVSTSHFSPWSLLSGLVLVPASASVKEGEKLDLRIHECYPPAVAPLNDDDPLVPSLIPGVPCQPYPFYKVLHSAWAVNQFYGGNATLGTIEGEWTYGHYTAPSKAPSPNTVSATAEISRYLNLRNISLTSHVTIGGDLKGTFTLKVDRKDQVKFTARGEATLEAFQSDENGIAYDMTGTVTIDSSFAWMGLTCSCVDPVKKAIPADAVFAIQRKPSLGQRWVMPAVLWNFKCEPGGMTLPVFVQYFVSASGDCSQQAWVALSDESHPTGSFVSSCNPAFTVGGSWDFSSN